MRNIAPILALGIGLASCAQLTAAVDTLTGARVSPQAVYVAENVFDGYERTATNYFRLCHKAPANPICSKTAEVQIADSVRAGRVARNNLRAFMKAHPDALGASGLYDALTAASDTLKSALQTYGAM